MILVVPELLEDAANALERLQSKMTDKEYDLQLPLFLRQAARGERIEYPPPKTG